ncbi:MAG: hypothetical protein RE472_04610 [Thermoplasmatales archaeon]|nr:MAG: hypothetical protein RE472_04610 [Thermoplasmatales archaeon]
MKKSIYAITTVGIISIVILVINILAFLNNDVTEYLYILDMVYVIGNSAHLVALSLSSSGLDISAQNMKGDFFKERAMYTQQFLR